MVLNAVQILYIVRREAITMTFTELMLQKFPNADLRNLFIDCCPCNFGIETEMTRLCNNGHECFEDCKICWNSQIVGDYITTKKKNNNETLMAV